MVSLESAKAKFDYEAEQNEQEVEKKHSLHAVFFSKSFANDSVCKMIVNRMNVVDSVSYHK